MYSWISLHHQSFISGRLVHETNINQFLKLKFIYKNNKLVVKSHEETLVDANGGSSLKIMQTQFKVKYLGQSREALVADSFQLEFGRPLLTDKGYKHRTLLSSMQDDESYDFFHYNSFLKTNCEIRSRSNNADPMMMLGYLAYFWAEAESDRLW
jgi:hypothetical protein